MLLFFLFVDEQRGPSPRWLWGESPGERQILLKNPLRNHLFGKLQCRESNHKVFQI
jgi:hypothetical protein